MSAWLTAMAAALLWAIALYFALRQYRRIGRSIHRTHLQDHIRSSFLNAEELEAQMAAGTTDEVVAIRWAMLAEQAQDWPETMRRAEIVMTRYPDQLEGPMLQVQALRATGDQTGAEALARKWLYKFPNDIELICLLVAIAHTQRNFPAVLKLARALRHAAPLSTHPHLLKIDALFEIGDLKRVEKALVAAEAEFPGDPDVAKLWDRYEAILAGPESAQSGS